MNIPDMNAHYTARQGSTPNQDDEMTTEHHHQVDIFVARVDSKLQELNNKFSANTKELFSLNMVLDFKYGYKMSKIHDYFKFAENFIKMTSSNERKIIKE